jgi:endothelin-converting enzyme
VDEENFNMMKALYNTCLDEATLKKLGIAPLVALLDEIAKAFPIEESAYGNSANIGPSDFKDIRETMLLLSKQGISTIEGIYVGIDDKDPVSTPISLTGTRLTNLLAS